MNWTKILGAGLIGGIVVALVNYVLHGIIMADSYKKYSDAFSQVPANPVWFFVVAIAIAIFFAILFTKTRSCWAEGAKGGMVFGFWIGMVAFFANFYDPLVINGFPYHLAWCHGGIGVIGAVIGGAVIGLIIKR